VLLATATVGTTLAPWGLSFIQSYAADKHLTVTDLRYERVDVIFGSVLTGIIGFFVVVACAATLYKDGITIHDAADAALALKPLAGRLAADLFAVGLIGAAILAASILPLSTAYSVGEFVGRETALDAGPHDAPLFYGTYASIAVISAAVVLVPGAPLIPILILTQVLNAVLLVPLLGFMYGISRNSDVMGRHTASRTAAAGYLVAIVAITVCIVSLAVLSFR
jgi:Mn2+/Fe2+ NRAMP family transporter